MAATGDNLLQPPDRASPHPSRRLGMTRRKDFKKDFEENPEEKARRHKEKELKPLYKELLYTIMHKLGKPASAKDFTVEELRKFIREAFGMTESEHSTLMEKVQHTEPPVYCLMVTVKEAKDILGKDISGFSDPYCLLTIMEDEKESRTRGSRAKPRKFIVKDVVSEDKIFHTEVKNQTLNPIWNQTFIIEFEDSVGASFHLEMWDKDEEMSLSQRMEEFNFHHIKRLIKDAKKEKGEDDFLGNVVLKLQDLHCTEDNWYDLEPKTETYPDRGKCHLNLKFIHKERDMTLSAGRCAYVNYCGILQQFVQAYITTQQGSDPWKGELCAEAQVLLELYATQNDLSPFLQDLAKWVAYGKLYQTLEVDSSVLLQQITSIEYHWHQQELPYQQKRELGDSLHDFLHYGLHLVSKYRDIFPHSATFKLQRLLRILMQICKTQAFQKLNPARFELQNEVADAVQEGTQEWFTIKKGLHQPMTKDLSETVKALLKLTEEVQQDIKHSKDVWNKIFVSVQMDLFTIVYQKLESLLAAEVRDTLSLLEGHMDQDIANNLSPLYQLLKAIHQDKAFLQKRNKLLELTNFHEGFREALPYWLNKAFSTTKDRVEKAVLVDQLQPLHSGPVPIKHSSSAVDLVSCIQPICKMWEQLAWPDPEEAFMLMVKLTEDVCKIMATYCTMLKEKVRTLSKNSDHGSAINMLCVVVNDLEYLRSFVDRLHTQLNWAGLQERTRSVIAESQFHNTLPSQLEQAQTLLRREIRSALDTLGKKLNTDIETYLRSMGTRRRLPSKSTEDAVGPLMKYLDTELSYMNENLVQENFNSLLTPLWMNSVKTMYQMMTQYPHQEGLMVFCQRLHYTLECLEQCFHAEGIGLALEDLHTKDYKSLKVQLTHNCLSSQQLIERFLEKKVWDQKVYNGEKYGAVTLLTSYRRSDHRLRVEVLNAANLLPLDSNGSSDPFVQLSLEPRHIFFEVEARRTQIKTCDLNPLFEEAFEFLVSLEQCRALGACLVVTVLDHDTLSSDDFEGEAFLALKAVPGVGGGDELDGSQPDATPAQMRLPLMHPKPNDDNLKLLESRKGDKEGQAFVKKRRLREKQSKEGIHL